MANANANPDIANLGENDAGNQDMHFANDEDNKSTLTEEEDLVGDLILQIDDQLVGDLIWQNDGVVEQYADMEPPYLLLQDLQFAFNNDVEAQLIEMPHEPTVENPFGVIINEPNEQATFREFVRLDDFQVPPDMDFENYFENVDMDF